MSLFKSTYHKRRFITIIWRKMRIGQEMMSLWVTFCFSHKINIVPIFCQETSLIIKVLKRKLATKTYSKWRMFWISTTSRFKHPWTKKTSAAHYTRKKASSRKTSAKLSKTPNFKAKSIFTLMPSKLINKTKIIMNSMISPVVSTLLVRGWWTQLSHPKITRTPTPKGPSLSLN